MDAFYIGQEVITRKGKRGKVEGLENGKVLVRFGPRQSEPFAMNPGQLVSAKVYDRAGKGYSHQQ